MLWAESVHRVDSRAHQLCVPISDSGGTEQFFCANEYFSLPFILATALSEIPQWVRFFFLFAETWRNSVDLWVCSILLPFVWPPWVQVPPEFQRLALYLPVLSVTHTRHRSSSSWAHISNSFILASSSSKRCASWCTSSRKTSALSFKIWNCQHLILHLKQLGDQYCSLVLSSSRSCCWFRLLVTSTSPHLA